MTEASGPPLKRLKGDNPVLNDFSHISPDVVCCEILPCLTIQVTVRRQQLEEFRIASTLLTFHLLLHPFAAWGTPSPPESNSCFLFGRFSDDPLHKVRFVFRSIRLNRGSSILDFPVGKAKLHSLDISEFDGEIPRPNGALRSLNSFHGRRSSVASWLDLLTSCQKVRLEGISNWSDLPERFDGKSLVLEFCEPAGFETNKPEILPVDLLLPNVEHLMVTGAMMLLALPSVELPNLKSLEVWNILFDNPVRYAVAFKHLVQVEFVAKYPFNLRGLEKCVGCLCQVRRFRSSGYWNLDGLFSVTGGFPNLRELCLLRCRDDSEECTGVGWTIPVEKLEKFSLSGMTEFESSSFRDREMPSLEAIRIDEAPRFCLNGLDLRSVKRFCWGGAHSPPSPDLRFPLRLESLTLSESDLSDDFVIQMISETGTLKKLNLLGCGNLTGVAYPGFPHLEVLKLSSLPSFEGVFFVDHSVESLSSLARLGIKDLGCEGEEVESWKEGIPSACEMVEPVLDWAFWAKKSF